MKKRIGMILCMMMVLQVLIVPAYAADDAPGLNYRVALKVCDTAGKRTTNFDSDGTVVVEVVLESIGSNTAPMYAIQGKLRFNHDLMSYSSSTLASDFQISTQTNTVNFAFLDRTGEGRNVSSSYLIGTFRFITEKAGTIDLMIEDVIITNSNATTREVDFSDMRTITIGTGVKTPDKHTLITDITADKDVIDSAIVSDEDLSLIYPAFRVTVAVAAAFRNAIDAAQLVYEDRNASASNIDNAIVELSKAREKFMAQKIYGVKPKEKTKVTVIASSGENGSIAPNSISQKVYSKTSVTIISIPDDGYRVEYVYVNGERFEGAEIFSIPSVTHDTEVRVTFCKKTKKTSSKTSSKEKAKVTVTVSNENLFTDVAKEAWYYDAVEYVVNGGLFNGISETIFEPDSTMTRAMLVMVLYRLEGESVVKVDNIFTDVSDKAWYSDAVYWANSKDIVGGYGNGLFGANDSITRQDMVVILYRYAKNHGYDVSKGEDLDILSYEDEFEISEYAIPAMQWAVDKGLIEGTSKSTLSPIKTTTRAQVAAILMRFVEKMVIE